MKDWQLTIFGIFGFIGLMFLITGSGSIAGSIGFYVFLAGVIFLGFYRWNKKRKLVKNRGVKTPL